MPKSTEVKFPLAQSADAIEKINLSPPNLWRRENIQFLAHTTDSRNYFKNNSTSQMRTGIPWKYPGLCEGSEQENIKAWLVF